MFSQNSMAYISRTNPYMQIPSPNRDFYKPRMVYARQTDDFVVKNIKKHNFLDIYDVITQNDVILRFLT